MRGRRSSHHRPPTAGRPAPRTARNCSIGFDTERRRTAREPANAASVALPRLQQRASSSAPGGRQPGRLPSGRDVESAGHAVEPAPIATDGDGNAAVRPAATGPARTGPNQPPGHGTSHRWRAHRDLADQQRAVLIAVASDAAVGIDRR